MSGMYRKSSDFWRKSSSRFVDWFSRSPLTQTVGRFIAAILRDSFNFAMSESGTPSVTPDVRFDD
jgi:hypothetical protein